MSLVVFDLETGGLTADHPDIQLAAIAVDSDWKELESFERKIVFKPEQADPEALELNHYDPAIWEREAEAHGFVIGKFSDFLKRHADIEMISKRTGKPYHVAQLAGYNALTFDGPRLKAAFSRWDMFLPAHPRELCVLQRASWWFLEHPEAPKPPSLKLGDVCAAFGIKLDDAHDALSDVRATIRLARALSAHGWSEVRDVPAEAHAG